MRRTILTAVTLSCIPFGAAMADNGFVRQILSSGATTASTYMTFRDDKLVFLCAPNHPMASKSKVSLSAIAGVPFIGFDREAPTRKGIDRIFKDRGLDLTMTMEMDNVETIKRSVEAGLGVSILPAPTLAAELRSRSLVRAVLREGPLMRPITGTRPHSTLSPSLDSMAGSTVTEPSTATATTRIVPTAKPVNTMLPAKNMPAMAIITVRPEMTTAWPDVAAANSKASSLERPASRSSILRRK